mmetsp:Transcript_18143/g.36974  ORF Transcript_18143/g.36974 Transcript_18143/m.36974 type:complete len:252 (+) Transcript_18143:258-1013(+)
MTRMTNPSPDPPILHARLDDFHSRIHRKFRDNVRTAIDPGSDRKTHLVQNVIRPERHGHEIRLGRKIPLAAAAAAASLPGPRNESGVSPGGEQSPHDVAFFQPRGADFDARPSGQGPFEFGGFGGSFGDDASRFRDGDVGSEGDAGGAAGAGFDVEEADPPGGDGGFASGIGGASIGRDAAGANPIVLDGRFDDFGELSSFQHAEEGGIPFGSFSERQSGTEVDAVDSEGDGGGPRSDVLVGVAGGGDASS